jgi:hypothetical protein
MSEQASLILFHLQTATRMVRAAESQDVDWVKEISQLLPTVGRLEVRDLTAFSETVFQEGKLFLENSG